MNKTLEADEEVEADEWILVRDRDIDGWRIKFGNGDHESVAVIFSKELDKIGIEGGEVAQLFLNAPDLLDAAELMVRQMMSRYHKSEPPIYIEIEELQKAVAKAKGKADD